MESFILERTNFIYSFWKIKLRKTPIIVTTKVINFSLLCTEVIGNISSLIFLVCCLYKRGEIYPMIAEVPKFLRMQKYPKLNEAGKSCHKPTCRLASSGILAFIKNGCC